MYEELSFKKLIAIEFCIHLFFFIVRKISNKRWNSWEEFKTSVCNSISTAIGKSYQNVTRSVNVCSRTIYRRRIEWQRLPEFVSHFVR